MSMPRSLLALVPLALAGLAPAAAGAAVVYCTSPGVPAGCVVRATPHVAAPAPVVVAPPPVVAGPRYVAPRSAVNRGGPVNRVGVR